MDNKGSAYWFKRQFSNLLVLCADPTTFKSFFEYIIESINDGDFILEVISCFVLLTLKITKFQTIIHPLLYPFREDLKIPS